MGNNYRDSVLNSFDVNAKYNSLSLDVNAIYDPLSFDADVIKAITPESAAALVNTASSLSSTLSFWAYQAWYLQTILPVVNYFATVSQTLKNILNYFTAFGIVAYLTKLFCNVVALNKTLRESEHIDLTGKTEKVRRLDKSFFTIFDSVVTVVVFVANFVLHAHCALPLLFIILGGFTAKSLYSTVKNAVNYLQCESPNATDNKGDLRSPEKVAYLEAVEKRHLIKLQRAAFDLVCIVATTAFFSLFFAGPIGPIIGSIGMLALGFISYYGREKYFTPKAKEAKTEAIAKYKELEATDKKLKKLGTSTAATSVASTASASAVAKNKVNPEATSVAKTENSFFSRKDKFSYAAMFEYAAADLHP